MKVKVKAKAKEKEKEKDAPIFYRLKVVDFEGNTRVVLSPPDGDGLGAILALGNALLLMGAIQVSIPEGETVVSQPHLISCILEHYRKLYKESSHKRHGRVGIMRPTEMKEALESLAHPIDVSVDFTSIDGIRSSTGRLDAFEGFSVKLHHAWIVNPEDTVITAAVCSNYYEICSAEKPAAPPMPPIQNADQLVLDFFCGIGVTPFGLQELVNSMKDEGINVLFWSRSFHVVLKRNSILYVLCNESSSFSANTLWREINSVINDEGLQSVSFRRPVAKGGQVEKKKCTKSKCSLEFFSTINLNHHMLLHSKASKAKLDFVTKDSIAEFWDQLSWEECQQILSIKDMKIEGVAGEVLLHLLAKTKPGDLLYDIANKLNGIINSSEKMLSTELFPILNEASEETFFSTNVLHCDNAVINKGFLMLREFNNVPACCSYFLEKNLIGKWFDHKDMEALTMGASLLDLEPKSCNKDRCSLKFFSMINFNRHVALHSKDFDGFIINRDAIGEFWDDLTSQQASQILLLRKMKIAGYEGKTVVQALEKINSSDRHAKIAEQLKKIICGSKKIPSNVLFDMLDKASEDTFFCTDIQNCIDDIIFERCTEYTSSNVIACISYMIERNLVREWSDAKVLKDRAQHQHEEENFAGGQEKSNTLKLERVKCHDGSDLSRQDSPKHCSDDSPGQHSRKHEKQRTSLKGYVSKN